MLRQEAMAVADNLTPNGFRFNNLRLGEDADGIGEWVASYTDDSDPPQVVIERWQDVYTEADPAPQEESEEDATDTTDEEGEGVTNEG